MSELLAKGDDMADDARNVAVLIDFENLNETESLSAVLDRAAEHGTVVAKLAVGDFNGNVGKAQDKLLELGILPVHQATAGKGRNSSDIRLAMEAVDLFHDSRKSIDVFVLASSDADFVPLSQWLRASGKVVVGAGKSDAKSKWKASVDEYVVVKTVEAAQEATQSKAQVATKQKSSRSRKVSKAATKATTPKSNVLNPKFKDVIEAAIDDVFSNGVKEVNSRALLKRIVKLDQQFSCKRAGFNSFRKLVGSFDQVSIPANPKTGEFVIRKRGAKKGGG